MDKATIVLHHRKGRSLGLLVLLLALSGCVTPLDGGKTTLPASTPAMLAEARETILEEAERALEAGRAQAAFEKFTRVLKSAEDSVRARLGIAESYLVARNLDKALAAFEALGQIPEVQARALQGRGLALSLMGKREAGQELLLAAVEEDPRLWRAWNSIGRNYALQGNSRAANESYDSALTAQPAAASVHNNKGVALMMQGSYRGAANSFRKALRLEPNSQVIRMNLRLAQAWQGNYAEALAGVTPDQAPEILNNIGYVAIGRGDYAEAEAYLVRAMEKSPAYYEKAARNLEYLMDAKTLSVTENSLAQEQREQPR
jgi:Tfp pilus assembly protein PilF